MEEQNIVLVLPFFDVYIVSCAYPKTHAKRKHKSTQVFETLTNG